MSGLKPFRVVPENIREWTRWMKAQNIPDTTTDASGVTTQIINNTTLLNYSVEHGIGTIAANAYTFEYEVAQSWEIDLEPATGNVTLTLSGGPPDSKYGEMNIRVRQDATARTITWAGGTFLWTGGTQPVLSTGADEVDIFHFQTVDRGSTWTGSALQDVS